MAGSSSGGASRIRQGLTSLFGGRTPKPAYDTRAHSWAKEVKSCADVPPQYRPYFESLPAGLRDPLPYSVLMPTFRGGYGHAEIERLLSIVEGSVHVLEWTEGRLRSMCYAPERLSMLEYGMLLLDSWMTIHGKDAHGSSRSTTVRFNSVTDYLMAPFVECLRGPTASGSPADLEAERARLDYLAHSHYKFRTYGRASLRMGATARNTIFQVAIRHELITFFGISLSRLISPSHLSLLTDDELITITDDAGQRWSRRPPHGAIWNYIPRSKISGAKLASRADGIQELSIHVQGGLCLALLFEATQKPHLDQLINDLRS